MNTFSHKDGLFMPSGCLSPEAMERYTGKQLSSEEMKLVDEHLASCAFCRDAIEGASQIPDFAAHSAMINERLRSRFSYIPGRSGRSPSLRNFLLPAAASVIVLVGIIAWFHYFYPEKQELALVTDTIPVHIDEMEMQEKAEPPAALPEKETAVTVGGVMNKDGDKAFTIRPAETGSETEELKQETPHEITLAEKDAVVHAATDESHVSEIEISGETGQVRAREEKGVSEETALNPVLTEKRAPATRQMEGNDKTFAITEKQAEYPGGPDSLQSFLIHNLQYPIDVDQKKDTTVTASFIVSEKGEIRDINIVRSAGKAFDEEVIRVIRLMPEWIPAKQGGKPIAVTYSLPVRFESD
ncbi:MAG: TonB family protein [Bacteroidales bacterium]|jgi:TonB family protein|nr:TonB family protein [Bacteroidales bacterium]